MQLTERSVEAAALAPELSATGHPGMMCGPSLSAGLEAQRSLSEM